MISKDVKKAIFFVFVYMFDWLIKTTSKTQKRQEKQSVCFFRVDGVGDAVIWLEVFDEVYNYYRQKGYLISIVCSNACKELYEKNWEFEKIYGVNIKQLYKYKYRLAFIRQIASKDFALLINFAYSRTISIDSIIRIITSNKKIANLGDTGNTPHNIKKITDRFYTHLAPASKKDSEHDRNIDFLKWLGIKDLKKRDTEIASYQMEIGDYFVLFPGASNLNKCWEIEKYYEVAVATAIETKWEVRICGGIEDTQRNEELFLRLKKQNIKVLNLTGKTRLSELAETIKGAKLVLTNDTSAVHFANFYNVKNICISKGCDLGRFVDCKDEYQNKIYQNHTVVAHIKNCDENKKKQCFSSSCVMPCISEITVEEILTTATKAINKGV